jgi:hypothetical protein
MASSATSTSGRSRKSMGNSNDGAVQGKFPAARVSMTARMLRGIRWTAVLGFAALLQCPLLPGYALAQGSNLAERARESIVYIFFDIVDPQTGARARVQGTGFVVSPSGYVLTAAHLFKAWRQQTDASKAAHPINDDQRDKVRQARLHQGTATDPGPRQPWRRRC